MPRYIDADIALEKMKNWHTKERLMDCVRDMPTADVVEVKRGYWEIVKGSNGKEKMVCTNCRHQQDLHSTFTYCPNCGALIDGRVIHNG